MVKLLICYLTNEQRQYTFSPFLNLLNSSVLKNEWVLLILTSGNDELFYYNQIVNTNINFKIIKIQHDTNNYMVKIHNAINYAEENNIPYIMKCDNDIFLKSQTLDFMINNLELLNSDKHLTITPVLSSGIPGIEYFMDEFLNENSKKKLEDLFLTTKFYDRDGAIYTGLNKHTIEANLWNKSNFFESVKLINHHYKGVHPIRFNHDAISFLNNYIIDNKKDFMNDKDLSIIYDDNSPYLCNSIFAIKTDMYKKIVYDQNLYIDAFDEVALNKYSWNNNMNHLFIKNGFCIHMYYNWSANHINCEKEFVEKFFTPTKI